MKGLAFEYIAKLAIIIAAVAIVIGLMINFSDDIQNALGLFTPDDGNVETQVVKAATFPESQVKAYIKSCWSKTGEYYEKDAVCYILEGSVAGISAVNLEATDGVNMVDASDFDNSQSVTVIRFVDVGDKIVVEN